MLKRLKNLFERAGQAGSVHSFEDRQIAAAVLLVEAACADAEFGLEERTAVSSVLKQHFSLDATEVEALLAIGIDRQADAVELHRFTHSIKSNFDHDERLKMMEMLWEVVLADGVLHQYEDQLLRRLAGLLYVSDRERGLARQHVQLRLADSKNPH